MEKSKFRHSSYPQAFPVSPTEAAVCKECQLSKLLFDDTEFFSPIESLLSWWTLLFFYPKCIR